MAMLESVTDLTVALLNEAIQARCEYEYNREVHSETGQTPLARCLAGPEVSCGPVRTALRCERAARVPEWRTLRAADGTLVIDTRRFEVPSRYRHPRDLDL